HSALVSRLADAASRVAAAAHIPPTVAIISGSGEFLARAVARRLAGVSSILSLCELWGPHASITACARGLLGLACKRFPSRHLSAET
ncbi:MAG TPA: hypothetical protein VHS97_20445, partial [Isosphaeraceae bacterium]|nr:hypothetical protein [Isosphaeraceae bacterium]